MIKATNNFVFVQRDEAEKEVGGLIIPKTGQTKTSKGVVLSIGGLVKDPNIKGSKGRSVLYHPTVGFGITFESVDYWVLMDSEIIAVV